jgi:hypothetical protein
MGKEKPVSPHGGRSGSGNKRAAHPVNVRIQAAGRSVDRAREETGREGAAVQPVGEGRERKDSVEKERFPSPVGRRQVGIPDSEIHWGVSRSPFSSMRAKRPGYAKRNRQPMGTVLLSVGAALVLGTIMGFSVLNLFFSDDPVLSPRSIDSHLERNPAPENESGPKQQQTVLPLADLNAVLLQGGSFSEKGRAQQTIQSHRSKGRAAVMTDASPHRIYLGVANNRDDALKLSVTYQKDKVDVYLRDLSVQGDRVRLSRETTEAVKQDLTRFVEDGHQIFQTLAGTTTSYLGSSSSSRFPDPSGLVEVHRRMMDAGTRLEKQLPSGARPHLQGMMVAADQAVQSAREAGQNPSAPLVWQTQEGLVRYALAYEALVSALK